MLSAMQMRSILVVVAMVLGQVSEAQPLEPVVQVQGRPFQFLIGPLNHLLAHDIQNQRLIDLAPNVMPFHHQQIPEVAVVDGVAHIFYHGNDRAVWMVRYPSKEGPRSLGGQGWNFPGPKVGVLAGEIYVFTRKYEGLKETVMYRTLKSDWKPIAFGVGQVKSVVMSSARDDLLIECTPSSSYDGRSTWFSLKEHQKLLGHSK